MKPRKILAVAFLLTEGLLLPAKTSVAVQQRWEHPLRLVAPQESVEETDPPRAAPLSRNDIITLLEATANSHGINKERFVATAKCESSLIPSNVGDHGNSYGLFQIHLPSHPDVTPQQALDPYFAVEWSAVWFKKKPSIWTCYRNLYL